MLKFSLVVRRDNNSAIIADNIKNKLINKGMEYNDENPELVICIGGDGTILYAIHKYLELLDKVYFVGVHTGTLGFFTDYAVEDIDELVENITTNHNYEVYESQLLQAIINDDIYYAVNEFRLESPLYTQKFRILIDDEFFEYFKGNGICLSTQAGSTAYNRSLKGAIIDSNLSLMQLTEIAGIRDTKHSSLGVPFILDNNRKISLIGDFDGTYLGYDCKNIKVENCDKIIFKMSNKKVKFIRYKKYSYLQRVRCLY